MHAGIATIDGVLREIPKAAAKRAEGGSERKKQVKQVLQIVSARYSQPLFLDERFEVLFHQLLTVKAGRVA
jgi:hypothetical protein